MLIPVSAFSLLQNHRLFSFWETPLYSHEKKWGWKRQIKSYYNYENSFDLIESFTDPSHLLPQGTLDHILRITPLKFLYLENSFIITFWYLIYIYMLFLFPYLKASFLMERTCLSNLRYHLQHIVGLHGTIVWHQHIICDGLIHLLKLMVSYISFGDLQLCPVVAFASYVKFWAHYVNILLK